MRSDKELLLLAAKAVGLTVKLIQLNSDDIATGLVVGDGPLLECDSWSPLHDDGDALRLVVKLRIDTKQEDDCCFAYYDTDDFVGSLNEIHDGVNPLAATRRAIVRAAAEIGARL